jgi:hypothetical protein
MKYDSARMSRKKHQPHPHPHQEKPAPPTPTPMTVDCCEQVLSVVNGNTLELGQIALELQGNTNTLAQHSTMLQEVIDNLKKLSRHVKELQHTVDGIAAILKQVFPPTTGFKLTQTSGGSMAGPYQITAGKSGTFLTSNLPVGSLGLFPGTMYSYAASDPAVTVGSDPSDPTNNAKIQCSVPATDTAPSFDLSVSGTPANADGSQGTTITNTFTVVILQPTPPGTPTTAFDLTQTS